MGIHLRYTHVILKSKKELLSFSLEEVGDFIRKQAIEFFGVSIDENNFEINQKETKLLRQNKKII
jgi:hypothetical protein